jgi:hypothetical protein
MRRVRSAFREAIVRGLKANPLAKKSAAAQDDAFREFIESTRSSLLEAYRGAWIEGGRKAGGDPSEQAARLAAEVEFQSDEPYLVRFAGDVVLGDKYTEGELDWPMARAELYVKRIRGVGNRSFVESSPDDLPFRWILGEAEHCDDCPRLAAEGPYFRSEMAHVPADGSTQCLGQCRCRIERADGVDGILPEEKGGWRRRFWRSTPGRPRPGRSRATRRSQGTSTATAR